MKAHIPLAAATLSLALASVALPALAQSPPSGLAPGAGSAVFRFVTGVQTPKGAHSGSGTVTIKRTGERSLTLTVQSDDGTPAHAVPLVIGADGTVSPAPGFVAPPAVSQQAKEQAATLVAEMTAAAKVGIAARKSAGAANFTATIALTPVGEGTPVPTTIALSGAKGSYTGRAGATTQTVLPNNGSLDPQEIAKSIGIAALARGMTPAGRAATGILRHHKKVEEKKAASGPLPDSLTLTISAELSPDGRIHEIRGAQSDVITLMGKAITIQSNWSFTRTSP
jgi:hypothetical protein